MRKVILGVAVSLDGFIEGPQGEYDWCFTDQDYGMSDFFKQIDTIVMGRKSYEVASSMGGSSPWKGITTYVYSNTLSAVEGNDTKLVSGDLVAETKKLKAAPGKDIWLFGGAQLTTLFINEKLVDELWLAVHPILLGAGKSLFHNIADRYKLQLLETKTYDSGLFSVKYALL